MNKELWINKEIDIIKEYEKENYAFIDSYVQNNDQLLMEKYVTETAEQFNKRLSIGSRLLRRVELFLFTKSSVEKSAFQLGVLKGMINCFLKVQDEKYQDELYSGLYKESVLSVKHLDEILLLLEKRGMLTHSEICEYLKLNTSTLSEIMKKIDYSQLLSVSRSGKYKLYKLNDKGSRIAKQLRQEKYSNTDGELLNQIKQKMRISDDFRKEINNLIEEENLICKKMTAYFRDRQKISFDIDGVLKNNCNDSNKLNVMASMEMDSYNQINNSKNQIRRIAV